MAVHPPPPHTHTHIHTRLNAQSAPTSCVLSPCGLAGHGIPRILWTAPPLPHLPALRGWMCVCPLQKSYETFEPATLVVAAKSLANMSVDPVKRVIVVKNWQGT
jgi:hypothetical protein